MDNSAFTIDLSCSRVCNLLHTTRADTARQDQGFESKAEGARIAKNAPMSGAGDLISTTTESSMASNPWRTPLGCRQTSPDPMMNSSEPTVDFTLPFTTYAIDSCV